MRRAVGRLALVSLWAALTLSLLWPRLARWLDNTPEPRAPRAGHPNYVIVAPEALKESAQAWAAYRQGRGHAVRVVALAPDQQDPAAQQAAIRSEIQRLYLESGQPHPFHVLLLGHAHAGWAPEAYLPAGTLPLKLAPQFIAEIGFEDVASDDAYALDEAGRLHPIAFGRVPVTSNQEALSVLARTQAYEATPPVGMSRAWVELIASDSRFGPIFDTAIEGLVTYFVEQHLPDHYRWHMLYGHPGSPYTYPAAQFSHEVAERLNQGALLVTYIGHGSGQYLGPAMSADGSEYPVFTSDDVSWVNAANASVVTMIACSAGEYDQYWSLAESLLLQPGGPVATYAASRLTLPAANTILGKDLFRVLLTGRAQTAGEWVRLAESNYRNPGSDEALSVWLLSQAVPLAYQFAIQGEGNANETPPINAETIYGLQQHAYNLFGDPALALAYPHPELELKPQWPWLPLGGQLTFTGHGPLNIGETVTVTLYTEQGQRLPGSISAPDPIARYESANAKTLVQVEVPAGPDGQFSGALALPVNVPSGRYILVAVGRQDNTTLIGSQAVYVGWPPLGEALSSVGVWWLGVSLWLISLFFKRAKPLLPQPKPAR